MGGLLSKPKPKKNNNVNDNTITINEVKRKQIQQRAAYLYGKRNHYANRITKDGYFMGKKVVY